MFIALVCILAGSAVSRSQESLYKRLGGYDAIAAVTDDFVGRLIMNKDMSRFFTGTSDDSRIRIRQHIIDFFCMKTGGPCGYTGRSMKDSHKGLKISESDWNIAAGLLVETLDNFKLPEKEKNEFLGLVIETKSDIVEN
ncbi:MAG: group 1 truncated hemoglobin [Ignavibacteria bacterium]|nr:group 1 truncated hemoglobin [Ignavibacteria bacterium]